MKTITLVMVTVYTSEYYDVGSQLVQDGISVEEAIDLARDEAIERYDERDGALIAPYRIVATILKFPEPTLQHTIVRAELPAEPENVMDPVMAEVVELAA